MRLHRLTLRNVKGVRARTVELPDSGVVVLEGPNEIGKTTLLEAFDALLAYKSSSRAADVRALQPVDRDEAPEVEAEFTVGGTRVRYAKRWLRQPSTTLHVLGARPQQLTGDRAQQHVDALLDAHLDRTLFDALRYAQAGDGSVAPLVSSTVLTAALDAAAGARQHAEGSDAILDRVDAEYRLYFTATGRPTGDYRAAMARQTQAQDDVAEAHRRVEEGSELLLRQSRARGWVARQEAELDEARRELALAERAAVAVREVTARHEAALEALAQGQELRAGAVRALAQRERLVSDERTLTSSLEVARRSRSADAEQADQLRATLLAAEEDAARAARAVEDAEAVEELARADAGHLADVRQLAESESLLRRAGQLVEEVRHARQQLPAQPVPRDVARRVRRLQDRHDVLVGQHTATTPALEVESLGADVHVRVADGSDQVVAAGTAGRVGVTHDTTVEVPGGVRIRVLLPEEALGRVSQIDTLRDQLQRELEELGAGSVEEVDALADATESAHGALRDAVRDAEAVLRPFGSALAAQAASGVLPAVLQERVEQVRRQVRQHADARSAEGLLPTDESEARAVVESAAVVLRAARAEQRRTGSVLATSREAVTALTRRLDQAEGRIEADSARLGTLQAQLEATRGEVSDAELLERLTAHEERCLAAEEAVRAAALAVAAADVDEVLTTLSRSRARAEVAVRTSKTALAELNALNGQVEMAAGEGRQELYDLAVAVLDDAERELQAIDRRARAARHLRTTLTEHREAAHRLYVQPYTRAVEDLGRSVYGPTFGVTVDEDLSLSARTLDGVTVPYAELSGGAKEQLGILARLAVARLVDPEHGCPVVIDDALGYSDPQRLRRMGEVLGSAAGPAGEVQVILLTCTPERYAAIPDLRTVRLTA
ncbi:AAA family ATPase [Ornithinimicrobium cerasi]|uniref:AAA domain-containing protein n=1 Tax=Ornithinimicrobium cerasi TaxID=2248773 RepID=A0A285VQT5_9MICO|nr:AAA family ATPase [Ornithinimicrobium cerasi]SOC56434.1 AAA domain-containing protein [Ornithinimicrobium cerasi]